MLIHRRILETLISNHGAGLSDDSAVEALSNNVELFVIDMVSRLVIDPISKINVFEEDISEEMLMKDLEGEGSKITREFDYSKARDIQRAES
jgi:hypothetical protein